MDSGGALASDYAIKKHNHNQVMRELNSNQKNQRRRVEQKHKQEMSSIRHNHEINTKNGVTQPKAAS